MRLFQLIVQLFNKFIGAATIWEHRERPPPRNGKIFCRKMILFPKALLFATTFPKIVKNSIFLFNFYQKFSKISQSLLRNIFSTTFGFTVPLNLTQPILGRVIICDRILSC